MMRDLKFLRRNLGKSDEIENVPVNVNPRDVPAFQPGTEPPRAPLNAIQEPRTEQEASGRSRVERTPVKPRGRGADPALPLRTPEKHGTEVSKRRFGWAQRAEPSSGVADDGRVGYGIGGFTNMTPRSTRAAGRATPGYSESNSAQNTPAKSVSKVLNLGVRGKVDGNGGARGGNFAALYKGVPPPVPSGSGSVVNNVEVPHFDLKEDSSFWMDHNVQVIIRIRPLNSMERSIQGYNRCLKQESSQCATYVGQAETRFTFDHVACETIDQETLFRMTGLPMVENCLSGYNSCMFAYGQTGSGKTYTMLGEIDDLEVKPSVHRGMTPRIFEFLFARIQAEEESRMDEKLKYNCKCSFLEIYNEQITDLLDPSSTNLLLREDVQTGVYVENLSEFEVHSVSDILRLLIQGSSNRRVAATNMNRESSRSHSVFTCVIESRWENDSTKNLRFARLNLVDLAGSERQKTSGAEGERLKEAASINKSLSTLGHVIMVLVDVANGRPRHIPYRDSRLTFLLQDSLGGNSKTMIIANVSPSICSAAETLNTLKFAQRAKLIQNNAVVNEDSTGDVNVLRHQIQLLQEELSILKRQNISRALSFGTANIQDTAENVCTWNKFEMDKQQAEELPGFEPNGTVRISTKQLKSVETTLSGALRREQSAETTIKELEAEIEQLNRLVCQREEDTRSTKMMLRFREDKIQRMESLLSGSIPADTYLIEENKSLTEQIHLLQDKVDKNPEVTRFALENIRLLEQLKRFEEFYEEGERDLLQAELSKLRDQLLQFLDGNSRQQDNANLHLPGTECANKEDDSLHMELKNTMKELDECRRNLNSCLDENTKLNREINSLHSMLGNLSAAPCDEDDSMDTTEDLPELPITEDQMARDIQNEKVGEKELEPLMMKHGEEMLKLQLELDIVKIMLTEERTSRCETEKWATSMKRDLEQTTEKLLLATRQNEDAKSELDEVKSVIEALESQQILSFDQMEDLRYKNSHYMKLLSERELESIALKEELAIKELRDNSSSNLSEGEFYPLQAKLKRMQASFEKAKRLNMWYQNDRAYEASNEEEMKEIQRQAEAETAEVIVFMQEELATLQQQVQDSHLKEIETNKNVKLMESELEALQENLHLITEDNKRLSSQLEEKGGELMTLSKEWDLHSHEIEELLTNGQEAFLDASAQLDEISGSFPQRRIWISDQVGRLIKTIYEKEALIEELRRCLEDANDKRKDMECMLKTLKGATLAITEAHQQEHNAKEKEILLLTSELSAKTITIEKLENRMKLAEDRIEKASIGATVAFVMVNRLSDINIDRLDALKNKDIQLSEAAETNMRKEITLNDQAAAIDEAEKQIKCLKEELMESERNYTELKEKLLEEKHSSTMVNKLEDEENDVSTAWERVAELKAGISTLKSSMYVEHDKSPRGEDSQEDCMHVDGNGEGWIDLARNQDGVLRTEARECLFNAVKHVDGNSGGQKSSNFEKTSKYIDRDLTILLLKKEIESALESLKEVQTEIAKLRKEKEDIQLSEKQSQENMKCLITHVLSLQEVMSNFEKQSGLKMEDLDHKLHAFTQIVKETGNDWSRTYEFIEAEVGDSTVVATQKTAEASCILAKFEEAQGTLTEADIIINELMIANESMKLDIRKLKKAEITLTDERDTLLIEVKNLLSINEQNRQEFESLEQQFASNLVDTKDMVVELEGIVAEVQSAFMGNLISISGDFNCMKSLLLDSKKLLRSWLEDVWSEIFVKDCAMSVLHLCHMGILLETVSGLNTENGLLQHGICESDSVIAKLREHNYKSRQELEKCRQVEGKLLADIKKSFDRISRKEEETGELSVKVTTFEKKISDLQLQEEMMLQRSNYMGSQLAVLMKEFNMSNSAVVVSLLNQEKLLKAKEEVLKSEAELSMVDLYSKDFESLILASELEGMALLKADAEKQHSSCCAVLEDLKKNVIFFKVDAEFNEQFLVVKEAEVVLLHRELEEVQTELQDMLSKLNKNTFELTQLDEVNNTLGKENYLVKDRLCELMETNTRLSNQVEVLEGEREKLLKDLEMKESTLDFSATQTSDLDKTNQKLQEEISLLETSSCSLKHQLGEKNAELSSLEEENRYLGSELMMLKTEKDLVLQDLEEKKSVLESCKSRLDSSDIENRRLQDEVISLETRIGYLLTDMEMKSAELMGTVNMIGNKLFQVPNNESFAIVENLFDEILAKVERATNFSSELECLESHANQLISDNLSLQDELLRKDDVLKGLLFDLRMLQESASSSQDQKDKLEEMAAFLEALEDELASKSGELDEAVAHIQVLTTQLQEKTDTIFVLELDISKECKSRELLASENEELRAHAANALSEKNSMEAELAERTKIIESLEIELSEMSNTFSLMNDSIESVRSDLNEVTTERDCFLEELHSFEEKLERAEAKAEENEAIAKDAQQIAETRKTYLEEKEAEVKLLETSVEELEFTVNVLENKVDIIKEEAEQQRLQREDLELELLGLKHQIQDVNNADADMKGLVEEKEKNLQEAMKHVQVLEKNVVEREAEITKLKGHISELNLYAEAQSSEYKQKFKTLEAMAEQVKPEYPSSQSSNALSIKPEKNATRPKGSGSPFKCIGLGMASQIKSEKDEDLTAARLRIQELESLAVSRQKEIFSLNARLAAAEGMTHDVIRDLLGLKLDMSNYASLVDTHQVEKITEKALHPSSDSEGQDVTNQKKHLNELIKDRKGWLEESERRHAELVTAQIALENLRQQELLLKTENDMLKTEIVNLKKKVMELDGEVKKLSGQQNIQQRIHHHAKIKEENNDLRLQNEDLKARLQRGEVVLSRVKEELAHHRASTSKNSHVKLDENRNVSNNRLKRGTTSVENNRLSQPPPTSSWADENYYKAPRKVRSSVDR